MVDFAAYMAAGAVLPDGGLNPFDYGLNPTAENGPTSLVKPLRGNVNIGKRKSCPDGYCFQELCSDGNWRWRWVPCEKWGCKPCREYRITHELVPEIIEALKWARESGVTLKHIVLTGPADDILTEASPEGSEARRSRLGKFKLALTRKGKMFEYLKVAESHKSGRIHSHLLGLTSFMAQRELQKRWGFRAWIEAVGMRCPTPGCYPGRGASAKAKRLSTIVPPPGKGYCGKCGYTVDWDNPYNWAAVAEIVALEMSKYLTKEASMAGIRKQMTCSRAWGDRCKVKPEKMPSPCSECADEHAFSFVGPSNRIELEYPSVRTAATAGLAYYPTRGGPCKCWGEDTQWVPSVSPRASSGLVDHLPLFNVGPGGDG